MKNFWKALGLAAIAAAVIPVKVKEDEETGKKKYQSLLMSLDIGPGSGEDKVAIGVNVGEGVLSGIIASAVTKKEGVLFADDEPEAAVVNDVIDFAEAAVVEPATQEDVDESDFAEEEPAKSEQDPAVPAPPDAAMKEDDDDEDFDPEF